MVEGAKQSDQMSPWIFALSLGMECEDLGERGGWNILNLENVPPPAAASPDSKMSPQELRSYLEGKDGGGKSKKKRKSM